GICRTHIPHRNYSFAVLMVHELLTKKTVQGMATVTVFDRYWSEKTTPGERFLQERWTEFDARFSRSYSLLRFLARPILSSSEQIEDVITNCRDRASQIAPEFEQEGAFRSWLVRVLIDEALAVLRKNRRANSNTVQLPKDKK